MGIDSSRQVNASVVLEREVYEQLKVIAKKNRRSISGQIAFWLGECLEREKATEAVKSMKVFE